MPFRLYLLLIFAGILAVGCQNENSKIETQPPRPVRTLIVTAIGDAQNATFNGAAVAGKESSLSFRVSGTIESIPVNVGDKVQRINAWPDSIPPILM